MLRRARLDLVLALGKQFQLNRGLGGSRAGVYLLIVVDTLLWRVGALIVIGLGVMRAFIVAGDRKRSRPAPEERKDPP